MRLRDNSKSNIYCKLVCGLERRQLKTFAGFFLLLIQYNSTREGVIFLCSLEELHMVPRTFIIKSVTSALSLFKGIMKCDSSYLPENRKI